jgi:hypothetical protein
LIERVRRFISLEHVAMLENRTTLLALYQKKPFLKKSSEANCHQIDHKAFWNVPKEARGLFAPTAYPSQLNEMVLISTGADNNVNKYLTCNSAVLMKKLAFNWVE